MQLTLLHETCDDFLDFTPSSCPRGVGTYDHRDQNKIFLKKFFVFLTQNLILGHSWWNFLPSFNFALGGKRGDFRWLNIDFTFKVINFSQFFLTKIKRAHYHPRDKTCSLK